MTMIPVTIQFPPALIHDLRRLALARDEAPGDMIRALLLQEVARLRRARPPDPAPFARDRQDPAAEIGREGARAATLAGLACEAGRGSVLARDAGAFPVSAANAPPVAAPVPGFLRTRNGPPGQCPTAR